MFINFKTILILYLASFGMIYSSYLIARSESPREVYTSTRIAYFDRPGDQTTQSLTLQIWYQ